jgi:hypothetical protein
MAAIDYNALRDLEWDIQDWSTSKRKVAPKRMVVSSCMDSEGCVSIAALEQTFFLLHREYPVIAIVTNPELIAKSFKNIDNWVGDRKRGYLLRFADRLWLVWQEGNRRSATVRPGENPEIPVPVYLLPNIPDDSLYCLARNPQGFVASIVKISSKNNRR